MLTRETIFKAAEPRTQVVEISDWQDSVTIRQLSAAMLQKLGKLAKKQDDEDDDLGMAQSVKESVIDPETGELVFTDEDIPRIQSFSVGGLIKLNKAINEFNGLTQTAKN